MNDLLRKILSGVAGVAGVLGGYAVSRASFSLFQALFVKLLPPCPPNSFEDRCGLMPTFQIFLAGLCALLLWAVVGYLIFHLLRRKFTKR